MSVYKVRFALAGQNHPHVTYIHASDAADAIRKLNSRFFGEPKEIYVESIDEDHGKFIVGSEERTF